MRLAVRLTLFLAHIGAGFTLALTLFLVRGKEWYLKPLGKTVSRWWCKKLAEIIGLKINARGFNLQDPVLYVANHISWLDIIALGATAPTAFMSKDDVRRWPVIGPLTAIAGTLFIKRGNLTSLNESINAITYRLKRNQSVCLFPEGTTTNGQAVNKFRKGLYQSAINAEANIQPIAIIYTNREGEIDLTNAPYIDDDEFFTHLINILKQDKTQVTLHYLGPIEVSYQSSRTELSNKTHSIIIDQVQKPEQYQINQKVS